MEEIITTSIDNISIKDTNNNINMENIDDNMGDLVYADDKFATKKIYPRNKYQCKDCNNILKKYYEMAKELRYNEIELPFCRKFGVSSYDEYFEVTKQKNDNDIDNIERPYKTLKSYRATHKTIGGNLNITDEYYEVYHNKKFSNNTGFSISIVFDNSMYETYEIAFKLDDVLIYDTPFTNDVIDDLDYQDICIYSDMFHLWTQNPEYCCNYFDEEHGNYTYEGLFYNPNMTFIRH